MVNLTDAGAVDRGKLGDLTPKDVLWRVGVSRLWHCFSASMVSLTMLTTAMAQEAAPANPAPAPAVVAAQAAPLPDSLLRVPRKFRAATRAVTEPYTGTTWAQSIIHEATGIELVYIPAGSFLMGSPESEPDRDSDEVQHQVTLRKGCYMSKYEVTQGQWERVMGGNPSRFQHADAFMPVESVAWDRCQEFCWKLGDGLRLPTEAEWEYACRAGSGAALYSSDLTPRDGKHGDVLLELNGIAWYLGNSGVEQDGAVIFSLLPEYSATFSRAQTRPAGQKQPNAWGLYDMIGNVWEWCEDWYGPYPARPTTDPTRLKPGLGTAPVYRVCRGGSWINGVSRCRAASRGRMSPARSDRAVGLRVVRTAE